MPDDLSPAQRARIALADAYHDRLGDGSAEAKLIMTDLRKRCYIRGGQLLSPSPGLPVDPGQLLIYEGARSLVWYIEDEIELALTIPRAPQPQQFATTEEEPSA